MGLQTKPSRTAPYSAINANLRKFSGIFRHGADVALMQGVLEHEAKGMGSRNMNIGIVHHFDTVNHLDTVETGHMRTPSTCSRPPASSFPG